MTAGVRSMEEILARVISREALYNPRMRGMWAVVLGGSSSLSLFLLAEFFQIPPPVSLDFLAPAGPPYRVLLVISLALEGLLAIDRLARHEEPPYPALTQSAAMMVASVGVILVGLGALLYVVWAAVLSVYLPGLTFVQTLYYAFLLIGSALLLAALPPLGASAIRPLVQQPAEEAP